MAKVITRARETFGAFFNIDAIKRANREAGQFYFEPDTMRFFKSKVYAEVYGGRFFITSEQNGYDNPRLYSVREAMPDGTIETLGDFQEHRTLGAARTAARNAAKVPHRYYIDNGKRGWIVKAIDPWTALGKARVKRFQHIGRVTREMGDYYKQV